MTARSEHGVGPHTPTIQVKTEESGMLHYILTNSRLYRKTVLIKAGASLELLSKSENV